MDSINGSSCQENPGGYMDSHLNGINIESRSDTRANLQPVFINQMKKHGEKLAISGARPEIFTFVGIVLKITATANKFIYEIEDDTGNCFFALQI